VFKENTGMKNSLTKGNIRNRKKTTESFIPAVIDYVSEHNDLNSEYFVKENQSIKPEMSSLKKSLE
jgi:hypothetical protein